jgi:hypothetical protein
MNTQEAAKNKPETIFLKPGEDFDAQIAKIMGDFDKETRETVQLIDSSNPKHTKQMGEITAVLEEAEKRLETFDETLPMRNRLKAMAQTLRELRDLQSEASNIEEQLNKTSKNLKGRIPDPFDPIVKRKNFLKTQLGKTKGKIEKLQLSLQ